jgi:urate oxidase
MSESGAAVDAKSLSVLTSARYGKDKIRVLRVVREGKWHQVVEYNVTALLEGNIASR